jgi:hypothetical protein
MSHVVGHYGWIRKPDARDKLHPMKAPIVKTSTLIAYESGPPKVQATRDSCVAAAWRALLNAPPFKMKGGPTEQELHRGAKKYDGISGSDYFGTTLRAGGEYLQTLDLIGEYVWAQNMESALNWMRAGRGPLLFGFDLRQGMTDPSGDMILSVSGKIVGGHSLLISAVDDKAGQVELTNWWGDEWGKKGRAWLRFADLRKLFAAQGELIGVKRPGDKWDGPKGGDSDEDDEE